MSSSRSPKRIAVRTLTPLIIKIDGYKAIKDSDLAALFEISLSSLYKRIGPKLWLFKPTGFFNLTELQGRRRSRTRPSLAFSQAGVILIAGILGDDASLEIGADIAEALRNPRRSSAYKKRPARRTDDADKAARYDEAKARLVQGRLHELLKKKQRRLH